MQRRKEVCLVQPSQVLVRNIHLLVTVIVIAIIYQGGISEIVWIRSGAGFVADIHLGVGGGIA
jgi:hypothetical protein